MSSLAQPTDVAGTANGVGWIRRYFASSIGKKQAMAVTGLAFSLFLVAHLAANLLIFAGDDGASINRYSHALLSNPLIYAAEAGLLFVFVAHVVLALQVTAASKRARGDVGYRVVRSRGGPSRRTPASQTMILSGMVILVFTVLHLITFKFGAYFETTVDGVKMRDLYTLVVYKFQQPIYVAWYVVAMAVMGAHLHHALWSAFETFGLDHPKWTPIVMRACKVVAWAIALGFLLIPVVVMATFAPVSLPEVRQ